jgi:hypothetical protein
LCCDDFLHEGLQGHALRARQPGPGSVRTGRACGHPAPRARRRPWLSAAGVAGPRWSRGCGSFAASFRTPALPDTAAAACHLARIPPRRRAGVTPPVTAAPERAARPSRTGHPLAAQRSQARARLRRVARDGASATLASDLPRQDLGTYREGRGRSRLVTLSVKDDVRKNVCTRWRKRRRCL